MNAHETIPRISRFPDYQYWSKLEDEILQSLYTTKGPQAVAHALPERTLASIYTRAKKLCLKAPRLARFPAEVKWKVTPEIDAAIRRVYEAGVGRGEVNALALRLNRPRHWVINRATALGLKTPRFKEPAWTEAEDERLAELAAHGHTAPTLARLMRKAGYPRTATACIVRLKRLGASRRGDGIEAWSATHLAKLMGVCPTTISKRWIRLEGLAAKRRGTERTEQQGGDEFIITRDALRRWLKDHAQEVDLRKVDKFWFWTVIF